MHNRLVPDSSEFRAQKLTTITIAKFVSITCSGVGGFNFLSTDGAFLGDDGSGFEEDDKESDSFLLGFKSLLTTGGGIS